MYVSSYSKADAIEQRNMVNSGVRGAKEMNLRTEVCCESAVTIMTPYDVTNKCHLPAIYSIGTSGDFVASARRWWSLGPLRTRAGSVAHYTIQGSVQHRALCYAGAAEGAQERRREGGTRERGNGRRKSLGLLVAGGKAAGAWVIGGRGGRRHAMEERM